MTEVELAKRVVKFLNELVAIDRGAVQALVDQHVPCNHALAGHPTVQCLAKSNGGFTVGMLGILNGFVGAKPDAWGYIVANFDGEVLVGFEVDETLLDPGTL